MELDPLFIKDSGATPISAETDAEKFQKIAHILCEKRRLLEEAIENKTSLQFEVDTQTLKELAEEMRTFGISEIDYQKHLVLQAKMSQNTHE